jgi:hypothetical protein
VSAPLPAWQTLPTGPGKENVGHVGANGAEYRPACRWHSSRGRASTRFLTRRLLEARLSKRGKREYVQVLRLLETFSMAEVTQAVEDALRMRAISFDAVKHLLLCRMEQRPPRLDLENYPHLCLANS